MTLNLNQVGELAHLLDQAALTIREVKRLTIDFPQMTLEDGYAVQRALMELKIARGEKIIGYKMGLTSKEKLRQMEYNNMKLTSPIWGVLTDKSLVADGGEIPSKNLIHPKAEPEIAFKLKQDLKGEVSIDETLAACEGIYAAVEILDSRFSNFEFLPPDVIADNCSAALFAISKNPVMPEKTDIADVKMEMFLNGKVVQSGSSKSIYGHPLASLAELSRLMAKEGKFVPKGSVVMSGAATPAVAIAAGDKIEVIVEGVGSVSFYVS